MTNYGYTESAANDYCFNSQGMGSCAGDCVGNTLDCEFTINGAVAEDAPVSYTHLTLPTIYSV